MKHRNDIMIGQELAIDIMVKNNSCANREIRKTCLNILPMTYDGQTGPSLTPRKFDGMTISPDEGTSNMIYVLLTVFVYCLCCTENLIYCLSKWHVASQPAT